VAKSDRALTVSGARGDDRGHAVVVKRARRSSRAAASVAVDIIAGATASPSPLTPRTTPNQTLHLQATATPEAELPVMSTTLAWFFLLLCAVAPAGTGAVAILGDSI
jgi:hypothetical protein